MQVRCNNCETIHIEDQNNAVYECTVCKSDDYLMTLE